MPDDYDLFLIEGGIMTGDLLLEHMKKISIIIWFEKKHSILVFTIFLRIFVICIRFAFNIV
jgi:hypothetical protein